MQSPIHFHTLLLYALAGCLLTQCEDPPQQFTVLPDKETGVTFRNDIVETQYNNIMTYEYFYNGGGVAVGDINRDGLADIYFSANSGQNRLYLNRGSFRFEDITERSRTSGREDWKTGVSMADVNGDGWLDIYVCYSGNAPGEGYNAPVIRDNPKRANQLFLNNGCEPGGIPTFTEQAAAFGLDAPGTFTTQAYFFDYDNDGDLDMFLLNHANMFYAAFLHTRRLRTLRHPYFGNKLYRNESSMEEQKQGKAHFVEVSDEVGIHGSGLNFGLSAAISDLNFDNRPDIYVTNDYDEQDFCYINNGDGTFREVSHDMFQHLSKFGMGSDIADINNDGLQDILVLDMLPEDNRRQKLLRGPDQYDRYSLAVDSGFHHQYMRNTLQLNRGFAPDSLPHFSEIGQLAGISNTDWSWAPLIMDMDNDGLRDIFVANGYLRDYNNLDFIKFTGNVYAEARAEDRQVNYLNVIARLPSTQLSNYFFRNTDGMHFQNKTASWGLTGKGVSNGAAYADLDNDGDLDLVTNNLNQTASVCPNTQERLQENHFVKIILSGERPNTFALGAKVWIKAGDKKIFQEAFYSRGYESSVEPVLTIGIGQATQADSLIVQWPDGRQSILQHIRAGQTVTVAQEAADNPGLMEKPAHDRAFLKEQTDASALHFKHVENQFVDFKKQRLLVYQLSRLGGKLAAGDVNMDGNDDVFFGGASGQAGKLFLGQNDGTYREAPSQPWSNEAEREDLDAIFFDADGDGDLDLYIVHGGSEFPRDDPRYNDSLYINNGSGSFTKGQNALPLIASSGSCAMAADYDHDGDQDLFVGGRHVPAAYGLIPESVLLRNESHDGQIRFVNVTKEVNPALVNAGMVTSGTWTDFNGDGWPDLILVGEWMPIRIFENQAGALVERNDFGSLAKSNGWWTRIDAMDIDADGDDDYLLGNAGTNLQLKASAAEPIQLYVSDLDGNGTTDPILTYYIQGKSYPVASRDELLDQVNTLRKRFTRYADYANATINDLMTDPNKHEAPLIAYNLQSSWLENKAGTGFILRALPPLAQVSCINAFLFDDFDSDGSVDILAAGNFFPYRSELGRNDASTGILLHPQNDSLITGDNVAARMWLTGDIRDMAVVRFGKGMKQIVVSRDDDQASVFSFGK